jgi:hypothetical protein
MHPRHADEGVPVARLRREGQRSRLDVSCPVEAERLASRFGGNGIGQNRVTKRTSDPTPQPAHYSSYKHEWPAVGERKETFRQAGQDVTAHHNRLAWPRRSESQPEPSFTKLELESAIPSIVPSAAAETPRTARKPGRTAYAAKELKRTAQRLDVELPKLFEIANWR